MFEKSIRWKFLSETWFDNKHDFVIWVLQGIQVFVSLQVQNMVDDTKFWRTDVPAETQMLLEAREDIMSLMGFLSQKIPGLFTFLYCLCWTDNSGLVDKER